MSDIVREVSELLSDEASVDNDNPHHAKLEDLVKRSIAVREKLYKSADEGLTQSRELLQEAQDLFDQRVGELSRDSSEYSNSSVLKDERLHSFIRCLGVCQCTLGMAFAANGEYKQSEAALRKSLVWFNGLGDEESAVDACVEMGEVCQRLGAWSEALKFLRDAIRIFRQVENKSGQSRALTNIGVVFWALQRFDESIKFHRAALAIAKEDGNLRLQARALSNAGLVYTHVENFSRAAKCFDTASKLSKNIGDHRGEARELNNKGMLYLRAERYDSAGEAFRAAHAAFQRLRDNDGLISTGFNLGALAERVKDFTEAHEAYDRVLKTARAHRRRDAMLIALKHLAILHWYAGETVKSMEDSREALKIALERKDRRSESRLLAHIGNLYARLGDHDRSRQYFDRSLQVDREIGEDRGQAETLQQIGAGYADLDNHRAALDYHRKSLEIIRELGDAPALAAALENVADAYRALKEINQSLELYKQGLRKRRDSKDRSGEARCLRKIGSVLAESGRPEQAIECFSAAREIQRNAKGIPAEDILETLIGLGEALDISGEVQGALRSFNEALAFAGGIDEPERDAAVLRVHQALADFYERNGEVAKAYEHHKNFYRAERKIRSSEQREHIKSLRVLYDIERSEKEQEIEFLRSENLEHQESNEEKQTLAKVSSLLRRKELLNTMQQWIAELSETPDEQLRERVDAIAANFEELRRAHAEAVTEEDSYASVHDDFIGVLRQQFPALSATELRIAALIKLKLNANEISRIVNLSVRSVEMYHQRIRKQLGLEKEADLAEKLNGIDADRTSDNAA